MLALVPVIYWHITNHLRTKWLRTITTIHITHKSVIQAGFDGFISAPCETMEASAMGLEDPLSSWLSHKAGKLVAAVDGAPGTFPHGAAHKAAWASLAYGGWVQE